MRPSGSRCGSLVVTHPFHPLAGRQLPVLYALPTGRGLVLVCEVDGVRRVSLRQEWTDRGPPPGRARLSVEGLTALRALLDTLRHDCSIHAEEGG
jgi:hypothetical protein